MAAAVAAPLPFEARAEVRAKADVSAEAVAESNPFLSVGDDTAAVGVALKIDPAVYFEDDRTTAVIEASARLEQFSRRYGEDASARLRLGLRHSLGERTALRVDASAQSSRSYARDFIASRSDDEVAPAPAADGSLPPTDLPIPDVTTAGRRSRVTAVSSGAFIDHTLSTLDTLSVGITAGLTRTEDRLGGDYQTVGGSALFRRMVSERTGIFASLKGSIADYQNSTQGDGWFLTPMLGLDYQLSDTFSVNVSAGVSLTSTENSEGEQDRRTSVAGELAICRRETRGSLCGTASRRAQPTVYGGITTATSLSIAYSRDLSDRDRLRFGGSYGRSEGGISRGSTVAARPRELVSGFVDYRRDLSDRLSGFITPRYERFFDRTSEDRDNYAIVAGISYRFGNAR